MIVNKKLSDEITAKYLELKESGKYKKGYIQHLLLEYFKDRGVKKTTCWDHSVGKLKGTVKYKVFDGKDIVEEDIEEYENVIEKVNNPKILIFDIETFANLGYVWGKYDQNVIDYEREWFVLSFSYKWFGEDGVNCVSLPDFNLYKKDKYNDKEVVTALWKLFDEAQIVVAHNGDQFDIKKMYARFLYHDLPPPSPFVSVDTRKVAKRYFNMNSNKLDDIGRYLGIGRKVVHTGWDLWKRCVKGDLTAWQEMRDYNEMDVILLERIYEKFRPYITNHPNINLLQGTTHSCPNCGSSNLVEKGFAMSRVSKYERYQCSDCYSWSKGKSLIR